MDPRTSFAVFHSDALPNELLEMIFSKTSPAVLPSIARVCRQWRAVAERLLYRDVRIVLAAPKFAPAPTLRCCQTIHSRPHLASLLATLHIHWVCRDHYSSLCTIHNLDTILSNVTFAISLATNLESLDLDLYLTSGQENLLGVNFYFPGEDRVFPALRHVSVRRVGFFEEDNLHKFLCNSPSLRSLRIPDYHPCRFTQLSPDCVPFLTLFCGSPIVAAAVLPGKPVQSVALDGGSGPVNLKDVLTEQKEFLYQISRISAPLRFLDLSRISAHISSVQKLVEHVSTVETLTVPIDTMVLTGTVETQSPEHPAYKRLMALELSQPLLYLVNHTIDWLELCAKSKKIFPHLRRIVFLSKKIVTYDSDQDRWITM